MYSHVQYSTGCQRHGDKWKRFSKQNKRHAASLPHGALQSGETDNERMRGRWKRYARRLQDIGIRHGIRHTAARAGRGLCACVANDRFRHTPRPSRRRGGSASSARTTDRRTRRRSRPWPRRQTGDSRGWRPALDDEVRVSVLAPPVPNRVRGSLDTGRGPTRTRPASASCNTPPRAWTWPRP